MIGRCRTALRSRRRLTDAWRRLPRGERRDALAIAALIPLAALAVRAAGFSRVRRTLDRPPRLRVDRDAAERGLSRALARARRHAPYRGNCLSQSIALCWLLRRRGVRAELRLGARIDSGVFSAHAWVVSNGRVLNDASDVHERFVPFQPAAAGDSIAWS